MVSPRRLQPSSLQELAAAVGQADRIWFKGGEGENPFLRPTGDDLTAITLAGYRGVIEHDVSDQVVVVRAGSTVAELQAALASNGQCLPLAPTGPTLGIEQGAISDEIALNLPHPLFAKCGSWRDWILGMRLVLADGTIAKCGSKAVKNVAGYDVLKLMIGARHSLGLVAEVTFKTYPLDALPSSAIEVVGEGPVTWIQRVRRSDFAVALATACEGLVALDGPSATLWSRLPLRRFEGDWVLQTDRLEFTDPTQVRLMTRAKDLFDPERKLNPGAMGIF